MPKPMLKQMQTQKISSGVLSASSDTKQKVQNDQADKMIIDRLLRKPRSKKYMEAVHRLDAGGHTHNQSQVDDIINEIRMEFPDIDIEGILLGFVAVCYLGEPYEVHTLDLTGKIIEHYKNGQSLPCGLEKARSIALYGGYCFIEVYVDCCRALSANGSVSVIPC